MFVLFISLPTFPWQSSRDLWSEEERVHGWAAEERRRDEADVRTESQREGSWAQRSRKRGTPCWNVRCKKKNLFLFSVLILPFSSSHSCMRSLTAWRSSTRTRKRNWRRRRSPLMTSSTCSNRKRLPQSSCKTKHSRQGAPPHSRGIKRGKSKYFSNSAVPSLLLFLQLRFRRSSPLV